jgi:hypothetical protein
MTEVFELVDQLRYFSHLLDMIKIQQHLRLEDFSHDNAHLYVEQPDSNFSPERNFKVIAETVTEYEKMRYGIDPKVAREAGNRADILASYGCYRFNRGTKKIEDYLGKELMAELYGEKLMQKIKAIETIERLNIKNGNDKFSDYCLS